MPHPRPSSPGTTPRSLDAAFSYYRQLRLRPQLFFRRPITVPSIAFAGLDDPIVGPADFAAGRRMFTSEYLVEEMRGGHFMHREHPEKAKLLVHL